MNELKRYDQELAEQLAHIPMPDENFAWAAMKKMLDEDDDDPVIIPFYRRFGCGILGLIGLLLLSVGGWVYYQKNKKERVTKEINLLVDKKKKSDKNDDSTVLAPQSTATLYDSTPVPTTNNISGDSVNTSGKPLEQETTLNEATISRFSSKAKTTIKINAPALDENSKEDFSKRKSNRRTIKEKTKVNIRPAFSTDSATVATHNESKRENPSYGEKGKGTLSIQPSSADSTTEQEKDSSSIIKKETTINKKKPATTPDKEDEPKKKNWMLAAGLTVYQPISLNGESAVPYNSYGRRGSFTDYIPSAYLRLYRNKKWFLHTEFRYGAPQAVKPFNYKQEQVVDSFQIVTKTQYQLKKTYYQQVPLSFNYYVLPGLSVGSGIIYNRFSGAVANQNVYRGSGGATDTLLSSVTIRVPDTKNFVKNHFQWSASAQYQWKRFFMGARYSKDIDPYIKFTDINTGASVEKKAEAFNLFIRYELWRKKL